MINCQLLLLVIAAATTTDAPPASISHRAEAAFGRLDYTEAVSLYREALSPQHEMAWLEFNLGTSALADNQFGQGLLHLRRAQVLAPRSEGVRHNLNVARERRQDVLDERETSLLTRWMASSVGRLTPTERRLAWGLSLALAAAAAGALRRKIAWVAWLLSAPLFALNIALPTAIFILERELDRAAVVVADELVVRASTHPDSLVRFRLHAGAEVEVRDALEDWVRVRLDPRRDGWTHRQGLCRVLLKS